MDQETIIIAGLIGLIAGLFIMYFVIRYAVADGNKVDYRNKHLRIQTNILLAMAKQQGLSTEEIKEAVNVKEEL